jgi:hydrogenase large subunit
MARTVIDPITRIEGHLRVEMEVEDGVITNAWSSGGCFRGMELVVRDRTPEDAAQIVQRICGVCPVSHAHAASIAGEKAYGITISNNARIIRNLVEGAQFLHSHILWFYNLCALDYVNPLNGLKANISDAIDLGKQLGLAMNTDLNQLASRLTTFADNKQLSIFSGNWFDSENGTGYKLPAEVDLILTGHYLEALTMQAKSSEIAGLLGGKMPHIMTSTVGGTMFVPTEEKLDDLWGLVNEVYNWVAATMIPDTLALAPYYRGRASRSARAAGRYLALGASSTTRRFEMKQPLPAFRRPRRPTSICPRSGRVQDLRVRRPFLVRRATAPYGTRAIRRRLEPLFTVLRRQRPLLLGARRRQYDGKPHGGDQPRACARRLQAQAFPSSSSTSTRCFLEKVGASRPHLRSLQSTLGRTGCPSDRDALRRQAHAGLGRRSSSTPSRAATLRVLRRAGNATAGEGAGFWEAPRGALYHAEKVEDGMIKGYQIIIPSTWNLATDQRRRRPRPARAGAHRCPG